MNGATIKISDCHVSQASYKKNINNGGMKNADFLQVKEGYTKLVKI